MGGGREPVGGREDDRIDDVTAPRRLGSVVAPSNEAGCVRFAIPLWRWSSTNRFRTQASSGRHLPRTCDGSCAIGHPYAHARGGAAPSRVRPDGSSERGRWRVLTARTHAGQEPAAVGPAHIPKGSQAGHDVAAPVTLLAWKSCRSAAATGAADDSFGYQGVVH